MNKLSTTKRVAVVAALVEGCSIRSTARMTDVSKPTILKLLADLGAACTLFHDRTVRDLRCRRVECDEIWQFCYAKAKNVPEAKQGHFGYGDVWTWTAIDADSKLVPSWLVGTRDAGAAYTFMMDVASRLRNRVQLTTDGHTPYLSAVEDAFGSDIDYATLIKIYGSPDTEGQRRYSPAQCLDCAGKVISGDPNRKHISTSYVERHNLTMRMSMRRFTRLTNGFSKKIENHAHAIALYMVHYNFARIHRSLRVTPAIEAGIAGHVWSLEEIVDLLEQAEDRAA